MSDAPEPRPRTWGPLLAAAAVGAVVLVGAIAAFAFNGGPSEVEAEVIAACEAAQAESAGAAVVAGEIYDPAEWRDFYSVVEAEADVAVPLDDLSPGAVEAWEARADAFRETGAGEWVIVWLLEDESHAQCAIPVGAGQAAGDALVGPLNVRDVGVAE